MNNQIEKADQHDESPDKNRGSFDYAYVDSIARIALYDDLKSAPRVTEILPAPTSEFIEALASKVYEQAKGSGGTIPYTVIREVSENFIHARFTEATVSILDGGNTIRFADQGPGISHKENAQLPGFTSAIEPMKQYIRGVGSGLPIVKEYLDFSHGTITIEDNLGTGSVVTVSLKPGGEKTPFEDALAAETIEIPVNSQEQVLFATQQPATPQMQPPAQTSAFQEPSNAQHPAYGFTGAPYADYRQPAHPAPANNGYYPAQQGVAYGTGYAAAAAPGYGPAPASPGYAPIPQAAAYDYAPAGGMPPMGRADRQYSVAPLVPPLSQRERDFLPIFLNEGALGVTDLSRLTGVPQSSTYVTLTKLEQSGLIEKTAGQKRILTEMGYQVASSL